jgi:glycosyltransferase involved in cell wall biosynthesis
MRLLFVVQRYGLEVAGGAELHARQYATLLAERGHEVDVLTSCAVSYVDWANTYDPGTSVIDGVTVHRLPVSEARVDRFFGPLNARTVWGRKPVPLYLQREWMRRQGPDLPGLRPWLTERAADYDVSIFITYLYYSTWAGLPVAANYGPTVLHPTAHDEPPFWLPLFDTTFRHAHAFAYLTPEERDLVERRFGMRTRHKVTGIGMDVDATGVGGRFRQAHGLGDDPYLLFVGRVDPGKGSDELYDFFVAYKARNPGSLKLAIVGDPVKPLPPHPDIVVTGFVEEQVKRDAYDGALALVHPSYFESFSMVLTEAWAQRKPALVQGHCDVLVGQARRSRGGLPYCGYAEFEAAVQLLDEDPALARAMGEAGRRYVDEHYKWDEVLDRYERLLGTAVAAGSAVVPVVRDA